MLFLQVFSCQPDFFAEPLATARLADGRKFLNFEKTKGVCEFTGASAQRSNFARITNFFNEDERVDINILANNLIFYSLKDRVHPSLSRIRSTISLFRVKRSSLYNGLTAFFFSLKSTLNDDMIVLFHGSMLALKQNPAECIDEVRAVVSFLTEVYAYYKRFAFLVVKETGEILQIGKKPAILEIDRFLFLAHQRELMTMKLIGMVHDVGVMMEAKISILEKIAETLIKSESLRISVNNVMIGIGRLLRFNKVFGSNLVLEVAMNVSNYHSVVSKVNRIRYSTGVLASINSKISYITDLAWQFRRINLLLCHMDSVFGLPADCEIVSKARMQFNHNVQNIAKHLDRLLMRAEERSLIHKSPMLNRVRMEPTRYVRNNIMLRAHLGSVRSLLAMEAFYKEMIALTAGDAAVFLQETQAFIHSALLDQAGICESNQFGCCLQA